jgi:hypothetical protein
MVRAKIRDIASLVSAVIMNIGLHSPAFGQAAATEPVLQQANLVYQGAFRVPQLPCTAPAYACFNYGGTAITYNSTDNSLYAVGHVYGQLSAEISIPAVNNTLDLNSLNTATLLQPFADPADGERNAVNPTTVNGNRIGGQLVYAGRLIFSVYSYYDGAGTQATSHFARSPELSINQISGPFRVGAQYPGFVSGYMTPVPAEWQQSLGGPTVTGNCCLAITSLQSNGPAASVFDPSTLGVSNPAPAVALVGYPHVNPLGPGYSTANGLFNGSTQITGIAFPSGTRSVLFFGRQGTGSFCYGQGTSNPALAGQPTGQGPDIWCYDPASLNKGTHAYPYVYQVWAYDANDLASVKNGSKSADAITPYATWTFNLPFENATDMHALGGVAYDVQHQLIYLSQLSEDANSNPIIHVFKVDTTVKIPAPPTGLQAQ